MRSFVENFSPAEIRLADKCAWSQVLETSRINIRIVGLAKTAKYLDLREDPSPLVFVAENQRAAPPEGIVLPVRSDLTQPNDPLTMALAILLLAAVGNCSGLHTRSTRGTHRTHGGSARGMIPQAAVSNLGRHFPQTLAKLSHFEALHGHFHGNAIANTWAGEAQDAPTSR
jgi:hypothetical protein